MSKTVSAASSIISLYFSLSYSSRGSVICTTFSSIDILQRRLLCWSLCRENYEFRLRYDEAGEFFIREMELKRKYREVRPKNYTSVVVKPNGWLRRNLSLTGLYYYFSNYGESIVKPTIIAAITIGLSTLFWLMQSNPTLQPTFSSNAHFPYSNFTGLANATNYTQWQEAFKRSLEDFVPVLSIGSDIKVGIVDFIVKIFGGALTFVLLGVALRRKFERKYTR